jgi:hypothetical protein
MVGWEHPEMPEGLLDGRAFLRRASGHTLVSAHSLHRDAAFLLAVGDLGEFDRESMLAEHPVADLLAVAN